MQTYLTTWSVSLLSVQTANLCLVACPDCLRDPSLLRSVFRPFPSALYHFFSLGALKVV